MNAPPKAFQCVAIRNLLRSDGEFGSHGLQFCALAGDQGFQSAITVDIDKLQALIHLVDERG
jgi:hypothetical protein